MQGPDSSSVDISVIIPTRNRCVLLDRLLGQVLRLDGPATTEVVVVDEGSSDGTPELLSRVQGSITGPHRLVVVRHDDPVGLPAARNAGFEASSGRYVAWIDDDDITSRDRLQRQYDALVESGARWSCAARVDIDDELRVVGHVPCPGGSQLLRQIVAFNCLPTAAQGLLVERQLAEEVGGYDTALRAAEDWEYCIRLAERSEPHLLDEPLVAYRTGVSSMSSDTARMDEAIEAVVAKHSSLLERLHVTPDWASIHQSLLNADVRSGRRSALRRSMKLLGSKPSARNAARSALAVTMPGRFLVRSDRRRRANVPPGWRRSAESWLADVSLASAL